MDDLRQFIRENSALYEQEKNRAMMYLVMLYKESLFDWSVFDVSKFLYEQADAFMKEHWERNVIARTTERTH